MPDVMAVQADACAAALEAVRREAPLVQCLTNIVAAEWTANILLALGAAPAMVDNPEEAGGFAAMARGVLVNLGTPYPDTARAMVEAVASAGQAATPWVLDPVAAGVLPWRTTIAMSLLATSRPAVVRGNASEIMAMAGGPGGRGVDSIATPAAVVSDAIGLATSYRTVVAVSGPVDHLTDGERLVRVGNGHPWMTRVTGIGCALGALMGGFTAVADDALVAATAATATLTIAAEDAAKISKGPGSFAVALLDALATLQPETLATRAILT